METYQTQFIETAICVVVFLLIRSQGRHLVGNTVLRSAFKAKEEKEILRLLNLLIFLVAGILLAAIWGVKQNEILLFATSVITVLGVAFFAEMSILSNVTSCLVLFFQHPVKIGDTIRVMQEADPIEGELVDITYFFVFIRTKGGAMITIPNSTLLKNAFAIIHKAEEPRP